MFGHAWIWVRNKLKNRMASIGRFVCICISVSPSSFEVGELDLY